jgi:Family of unknown function (DUF6152)
LSLKLHNLSAICVLIILVAAKPASAHHGVAWYDYSKTVTAKVTVAQFEWTNPHCKIYFDTVDSRKVLRHWIVEMHPPNGLLEHGWTRQTLHPGDEVSLTFRPAKNHSTTGLLEELTLPNGITLTQNLLLLPPGETMSIQEWTRRFAPRPAPTNLPPPPSRTTSIP